MSGISPTANLSAVGASLLTTGTAPVPVPAAQAPAAGTLTSYQTEYLSLQQYDTAELLYASFLTPEEGLANADSVLGQAATLLGTPASPATAATAASSPAATTTSTSSTPSSTSSASSSLQNLPSVASILAASDAEAAQTLAAYANAPPDSSIIDYQV